MYSTMIKLNHEVYEYMLAFQAARGHPPTLAQIVNEVECISYRSSARYAVQKLMEHNLVVEEQGKWAGHARRYRAVQNE